MAVTVLVFALLPLGTAFQFADDEGFEVIKPFMCLKGYKLYTEIWNDQPPLYTVLQTAMFRLFGPTMLVARLIAAGFGLLMIVAFYELVRMRSKPSEPEKREKHASSPPALSTKAGEGVGHAGGNPHAVIATLLFLCAPSVLLLSVSTMQIGRAHV